ncbi:MAG: HAD-IIA family hydrolase, partial [Actinomycetota bacterium]
MRLADRYRAVLLDLDGVLYRGDGAVPGAAEVVAELRAAGKRIVFLTNNSARTPEQVAAKLRGLGIEAAPDEVVTSARPTARLVAADGRTPTAYVIGRDGVRAALAEAGVEVLDGSPERADFVVVGWDGDVGYDELRVASVLARRGARLVATNDDASYPAPGGELWPGAGALLAAVETASGRTATVVGKPHRPLFDEALAQAGTTEALMVGDRVETDIAGAVAAGIDAVLVLSGASGRGDLLDRDQLPVAVGNDVRVLLANLGPAVPRPARADEIEAIRRLTEAPPDVPSWGPDGVWVIEDGGIVATATAEVRGTEAYLRGVATRKDVRGRELGTLVVAAAVGDARRRGGSRCFLLTETAEPFFGRMGFRRVAREAVPAWALERSPECPVGSAAMARELDQEGGQSAGRGSGRR